MTQPPKSAPDFQFETAALARGFSHVIGIDEVGRGPWAGPVVAAAVWLDPGRIPAGLNDSKKLSAKARGGLWDAIHAAGHVAIASATVEEIDEHNILRASHMAMERAVDDLVRHMAAAGIIANTYLLIDGNQTPKGFKTTHAGRTETVIKGDGRSVSIAAASIVAKIWRDKHMESLAQQYPGYAWDKNAGYGTKAHQQGLLDLGVTPVHRRSFKPIHKMLYQDNSVSD